MKNSVNGIEVIDFFHMKQEDIMQVFYLRNHPETTKWSISQDISLNTHLNFIESLKEDDTRCYFLLKKNGEIIGVVSLTRINKRHKNAYIGIYKNPKLDRVGRDLLRTLEEIAFQKIKLHALFLEVLKNNTKAIAFYERNGYSYQGCLKDFVYQDNQYKDVLIYEKIQ